MGGAAQMEVVIETEVSTFDPTGAESGAATDDPGHVPSGTQPASDRAAHPSSPQRILTMTRQKTMAKIGDIQEMAGDIAGDVKDVTNKVKVLLKMRDKEKVVLHPEKEWSKRVPFLRVCNACAVC